MAEIAGWILIAGGVLFFLAGTVGLVRFPDTLTRMHALTKADNLGLGLLALGSAVRADSALVAGILVVIWLLVLLASGALAALLAGAAAGTDGERDP